MKRVFFFLAFAVLSGFCCAANKKKVFNVCGKSFVLEVADSPALRQQGFMNRPEPRVGEGILFVFESEAIQTFWMKNVPYPLDILFFRSNGSLADAQTMKGTSPLLLDSALPVYSSLRPAQFAVELRTGSLKRLKLPRCFLSPLPKI